MSRSLRLRSWKVRGCLPGRVIVQPATQLPACSHVDVSGISQVPRRSILCLCLCLGPGPRPNQRDRVSGTDANTTLNREIEIVSRTDVASDTTVISGGSQTDLGKSFGTVLIGGTERGCSGLLPATPPSAAPRRRLLPAAQPSRPRADGGRYRPCRRKSESRTAASGPFIPTPNQPRGAFPYIMSNRKCT